VKIVIECSATTASISASGVFAMNHRSYQVQRLLNLPRRAARVSADVIARRRPENNRAFGRPIPVLRPLPPNGST
jgi:hypothetical protein